MSRKKLHILFIVNSLRFGGAEKHVITLLNNMDTEYFSLSLVYLKREEHLLPQLNTHKIREIFCCDVQRKIDLAAVRHLSKYIKEAGVNIILCTNSYSFLYGCLAKFFSRANVKIVDVFHTTALGTLKERLQMQLYRWLFKTADLLVYVCEYQRKHWQANKLHATRDAVVHNGVDLVHFDNLFPLEKIINFRQTYGFSSDDYIVGLCAAMRPEKAHGDLLMALAKLKDRNISVKALLIGDGPERAEIELHITELGLASHVKITGFVDDVRLEIASCDVMVLVSRNETFSIAALEAMAMAKPLVLTDVGGASEQVSSGENGLLCPPGDIETLVHHLECLADPILRLKMGSNSRIKVEKEFSLNKMVTEYQRLLSNLGEAS